MGNDGWTEKFDFTDERVKPFIGKRLLVGITHCNLEGASVSQEQFHGIIVRINSKEGIVIKLHGSEKERAIQTDISKMQMARPGQYTLRGTGDVVENPDYTIRFNRYLEEYKG